MKKLLNKIWFKSFFRKPKDVSADAMLILKEKVKKRQKTLSTRKVVINDGGRIENMYYQFKNGEYVVVAWFFASYNNFKIAYICDEITDTIKLLFINTVTKDVFILAPHLLTPDYVHDTMALNEVVKLTVSNTPELKEYLVNFKLYGENMLKINRND